MARISRETGIGGPPFPLAGAGIGALVIALGTGAYIAALAG